MHGDAAVQQFTEALRDANPEWVPGSDWFNDETSEIARYWYLRDPERAVRIAREIIALWRADRQPEPAPEPQPIQEPDQRTNVIRPRFRRGFTRGN